MGLGGMPGRFAKRRKNGLARRDFIVQRGRLVFVGRQPVQPLADFVRHLQPVQEVVVGEQPAVVLLDLQRGTPAIDGVEEPPEIVSDRPRLVRIGMTIRLRGRLGRQQAAILAEGSGQVEALFPQ
jgi:hypothetical protein